MRGQVSTGYMLSWIIFTGAMLIIIFGSLLFWLDAKLTIHADTFPAEAGLYADRVLFSSDGLAAVDITGRTLPGIIDAKKLSDPLISDQLKQTASGKGFAAKIQIGDATIYSDEKRYDALIPQTGGTGPGSTQQQAFTFMVLKREGEKDTPVLATINVVGAAS